MASAADEIEITIADTTGLDAVSFFRAVGVALTQGASRTGDGTLIIATGLTETLVHQVFVQLKDASGCFGPASAPIYAVPGHSQLSLDFIGAVLQALFDRYLASPNVLAWINSVDVGETSSGHVFVGRDEEDLLDEGTKGPVFLLAPLRYEQTNAGQQTSHNGILTVKVSHIWFAETDAKAQMLKEVDFFGKIIKEMSTFGFIDVDKGGNIQNFSADFAQFKEDRDLFVVDAEYQIDVGIPIP